MARTHSPLRVRCSTRAHGDFHRSNVAPDELEGRRRAFVDLPWTMLAECHGITVVRVEHPGDGDGESGDVAITSTGDAVLGCWVGDCAPIVLVGRAREFAVVHGGWRGLAGGVIDVAVAAFTEPLDRALLGPTIEPCCYEFGADDLAAVAAGVGAGVASITGRTAAGGLALDVPAAVAAALARHGVAADRLGGCTGCRYAGFSHRVRSEPERHVVAAWRPAADPPGGAP